MKNILFILFILLFNTINCQNKPVKDFKITILSTMLSDFYTGEWGFSALIELDGKKILFDTGSREQTVIKNAEELGINLNNIDNVFLSHNHKDHTGGLFNLRKNYPTSFSNIHVAEGIFYSRPQNKDGEHYILKNKSKIEALGSSFITYINPTEIFPGVWTTGQIERKFNEKNWSMLAKIIDSEGKLVEDTIPEDQSLFFDTEKGIVLVSGCGHAGLANTLNHIKGVFPDRPIYKILGGFHLLNLGDDELRWTANKMKEVGVKYFVGAHCTGLNSTYTIRELMNLSSNQALVGSVGTYLTNEGIFTGFMQ
ncbi:MAG: MBL fold metallo-hydrolase [Flavobacteriaceae bacterium]|tara:strand:- start:984 stop:1913 length:930 start_codon:yes stop_codon:yes gene_type:complete